MGCRKGMILLALLWTGCLFFLILSPASVVAPLRENFNLFEGMAKVVHFILFLGFTELWTIALGGSKKIVLLFLLLAVFLAGFTEYLQTFIEGRDGEFRDSCIDSAGAMVGIFLGLLNTHRRSRVFRKDLHR